MDLKQIEKLMIAMNRNGMKKVVLKEEGFELELEKESLGGGIVPTVQMIPASYAPAPIMEEETSPSSEKKGDEKGQGRFILSPMVGTFYAAPSPEHPPYVKVGDSVDEGTIVCIIEAMKVMNEVKAGVKGTIAEVLLKSGDPVEFGTKIFRVV